MLPLRYVHRWRIAGVILLCAAFAAALLPALWSTVTPHNVLALDKWLHGAAFAFLAVWFSGQYSRRAYWRVGIGLLAFGALIEAAQFMTSYRSAEWRDFYADGAGIAFGLAIAMLGPGGWSLRYERWLLAREE